MKKNKALLRRALSTLLSLMLLAAPALALDTAQAGELLQKYYIDNVSQEVLSQPTVEDMISALGDRYTQYLNPQAYAEFLASMSDTRTGGVGVTSSMSAQGLLVEVLIEGMPAQKAGIQPGDVITAVDGVSVLGQSLEGAAAWLRGDPGTQVTITVLRDGTNVNTWKTSEVDNDTLIRSMVGRELKEQFPKITVPIGETVLKVEHLTLPGQYEDISFELHKGEILGFVGLVGAGRTELMHSLFGMTRPESGKITLHGEEVSFKSPRDAIKHGIAYVTEDRKGEGLVLPMSVHHNTTLAALSDFVRTGLLQDRKENHVVGEEVDHLGIKVHTVRQAVKSLSGGNQQKVVLAKWMITHPRIIIFDEPTRGIDVGAKAEIYKIMCNYVAEGNAVIMISSEMPEAMGMSDRIIVLSNHKYSGELKREEFSQEAIVKMQFQYM